MRTIAPVLLVLVIGTSGMMLGMSGFTDAWGSEPPQTDAAAEEVESGAGSVGPDDEPVSGPVTSGESNIVGLIVDGLSTLVGIAGAVLVLPVTLMNLGFPAWFAIPVGSVAEGIVGIGIIEFATQREWT